MASLYSSSDSLKPAGTISSFLLGRWHLCGLSLPAPQCQCLKVGAVTLSWCPGFLCLVYSFLAATQGTALGHLALTACFLGFMGV